MRCVEGSDQGRGLNIAVIAAKFNRDYTDALLSGALRTLAKLGVEETNVTVARVPGVHEIPVVARKLALHCDALIVIGCVIRGETGHFDYVLKVCSEGVLKVIMETGTPITTAVLAVENHEQARARSGERVNRGDEAAAAAVETADLLRRLDRLIK